MSHWDWLDFHDEFQFSDSQNNFEYWTDKKGNRHKLKDMRSSHIKNILRMLDQGRFNADWSQQYGASWRAAFTQELEFRGEQQVIRSEYD